MITNAYFVYLLASARNGTLYIGLSSDLLRRVGEHRNHVVPGFTKKYNVTRLMWFEAHDNLLAARQRERQIKAWKRAWKIELFRDSNPNWDDLYPSLANS
ncbi:MAG TPA: GIY-YIG nuclease family protein [Devosia sp.]|nr:GIY-YIG nuclease family protein [Devosia sp.]